jgi:signal transduction histidine kinase
MLPKSVLHKKNGHARPPAAVSTTSAEMLHRVHSVREPVAPRIGADLLRFAHLIRTERTAVLFAQAAHEVDGLRSGMREVLARTRQSLDGGRLDDVRAMLERLREDADGVARLVGLLAAAAEADAGERRPLNVEDVIDRALELPALRPAGLTVVRQSETDLPPVAGYQRQLRQMLVALLAGGGVAEAGPVTIETSSRDGAVPGQRVVRVRIVDERPRAVPGEAALRQAQGIARHHGGSLTVESAGDDRRTFIIDLPAL